MKTENHRILIIDDERPVLMTLEALLKRHGYHVDTAVTASQGLKSLKSNSPSLVLMDAVFMLLERLCRSLAAQINGAGKERPRCPRALQREWPPATGRDCAPLVSHSASGAGPECCPRQDS